MSAYTNPPAIPRLVIKFEVSQATDESPERLIILGADNGNEQILDFARELASTSGKSWAVFEIFWPHETEATQSWDAVFVDLTKVDANDPADPWLQTLPPYAELTPEMKAAYGIEVPA